MYNLITKYNILLVKSLIPSWILISVIKQYNTVEFFVNKKNLPSLIYFLKNSSLLQVKTLSEIIAYDVPNNDLRFTVIYQLLSIRFNLRLSVYVKLTQYCVLPSIVTVHKCANWSEREVWDLFGIFFLGNPSLRRILTDYGFYGHPLRKDFPLTGFYEVQYNIIKKRISIVLLELTQELRENDYEYNNS